MLPSAKQGGEPSEKKQTCQHLYLKLVASKIMRNKYLLFKPPIVWYFVIVALINEYREKKK